MQKVEDSKCGITNEGGEQGDLLMGLAVHNSLEEVHQQLEPGGRHVRRVRARADQTNLQFIGREGVSRCWNQVA